MGNSIIWKCKYCSFANLSESDVCSHCLLIKNNDSSSINPNISLTSLINQSMPPPPPPPPTTVALSLSCTQIDPCMSTTSSTLTNQLNTSSPKIKLNSFDVNPKSSLTRLRINQKASQSTSNLKHSFSNHKANAYLTHFIDNDFPPVKQSLYMNGNNVKRSNLIHSNGFKQIKRWLRPHEVNVVPEETYMPVTLFADPSPKDVIQGDVGTCWFLSALALLAEKPFLLLNNFCLPPKAVQTLKLLELLLDFNASIH